MADKGLARHGHGKTSYGHGKGAPTKLTPAELAQMKRDREAGMTFKALSAKYKISSAQAVSDALRRADAPKLSDFILPGGAR